MVREFRTLQKRKMAAEALPGTRQAKQLLRSERQFKVFIDREPIMPLS
jgi:hypothetical protein